MMLEKTHKAAGLRVLATVFVLLALHSYSCSKAPASTCSAGNQLHQACPTLARPADNSSQCCHRDASSFQFLSCWPKSTRESVRVYFAGPCAAKNGSCEHNCAASWACAAFFLGHGLMYLAAVSALALWRGLICKGGLPAVFSGFLGTPWLHALFLEALLLTGQAPINLLCKVFSTAPSPRLGLLRSAAHVQPGLWFPCFLANLVYKAFLPKPLPRVLALSYLALELGILLSSALSLHGHVSHTLDHTVGVLHLHPFIPLVNFPLAVLQLLLSLYMTGLLPSMLRRASITVHQTPGKLASQGGSAKSSPEEACPCAATPALPGTAEGGTAPSSAQSVVGQAGSVTSKVVGSSGWQWLPLGLLSTAWAQISRFLLRKPMKSSPVKSMDALLKAARVSVLNGKVHIYLPDIDPHELPPDWMDRLKAELKHPKYGGLRVRSSAVWKGSTHMVLEFEWEPRQLRNSLCKLETSDTCQTGSDQSGDMDLNTFLSSLSPECRLAAARTEAGLQPAAGGGDEIDAVLGHTFQRLMMQAADFLLSTVRCHSAESRKPDSEAAPHGRGWSRAAQLAVQVGPRQTSWSHFLWPAPAAGQAIEQGPPQMSTFMDANASEALAPCWLGTPSRWCNSLLLTPSPACPRIFTLPASASPDAHVGAGQPASGQVLSLQLHCPVHELCSVKRMVCMVSWEGEQGSLPSGGDGAMTGGATSTSSMWPFLQLHGGKASHCVADILRGSYLAAGVQEVLELEVPVPGPAPGGVCMLVVEVYEASDLLHPLTSTTLMHIAPDVDLRVLEDNYRPAPLACALIKGAAGGKSKGGAKPPSPHARPASYERMPQQGSDLGHGQPASAPERALPRPVGAHPDADDEHGSCGDGAWHGHVTDLLQHLDAAAEQDVRLNAALGAEAGAASGAPGAPAAGLCLNSAERVMVAFGAWVQQLVRMGLAGGSGGMQVMRAAQEEWPVLRACAAAAAGLCMQHGAWPAAHHVLEVVEACAKATCGAGRKDEVAARATLLLLDEPVEIVLSQEDVQGLGLAGAARGGGAVDAAGEEVPPTVKVVLPLVLIPVLVKQADTLACLEAWLEERELQYPWTKAQQVSMQAQGEPVGPLKTQVQLSAASLAARQHGWAWAAQRAVCSSLQRAGAPGSAAAHACRNWCVNVAGGRLYVVWVIAIVCIAYYWSALSVGRYRIMAMLVFWPLPYTIMAVAGLVKGARGRAWLLRHAPGINVLISVLRSLVMSLSGPNGLTMSCTVGAFGRFYFDMEWTMAGLLFEPFFVNLTEPVPLEWSLWLFGMDVGGRMMLMLGSRHHALGMGAALKPLAHHVMFTAAVSLVAHLPRRLVHGLLERRQA